MFQHTYSKTFKKITPEMVWKVWSDVNTWTTWNPGTDLCKMDQPFEVGNYFTLKPSGAPPVKIQLVEVEENYLFTDCTRFPGAKMYGKHEVIETPEGVQLTTTLTITGPLGYLWRKIVGEKIVAKTPEQTEALVARARKLGK
jgi:hypothetical protein